MRAGQIIGAVACKYGLGAQQLMRKYPNAKRFAKPRAEAMATVRAQLGWSYPRIGIAFGGFHHTTVMEAVRKFNAFSRGSAAGLEFARPHPTARGNRQEIDELRARVQQLERIVAAAGLMACPPRPAASEIEFKEPGRIAG
jgi:hypothetical protein